MTGGSPTASKPKRYRYYDLLMASFVTVLLCSNLIGPGKVAEVAGVSFGVGNIFFPISYIFGDVLTEVYGYARARRVIWAGFGGLVFASFMSLVILHMPLDAAEPFNGTIQPALEVVFGGTWRIVLGSIVAFLVGDFVNSYVLAKMKLWTRGRFLWTRTIGSTIAGQGIDSALFYPIAFAGVWSASTMAQVIVFNWIFKVAVEAAMTPATYAIIGYVKAHEHEDVYDDDTDFSPCSLRV
jgi:uncharacterized integral membrane protein (TIGR00697 family)